VLRTNLSTRPFYNERIVHVLLALAAVVVLVVTAFNAIRILTLSKQNTELSAVINRDRAEAQRLTAEARKIRAGINQEELQATATAAAEANRLIEQRTFSWTDFFNRIEETLPADVMLTAVQPSFEEGQPIVTMTVLGRRTEDVDEFIEKLEETGAFGEVLPVQSDLADEGLNRVVLRTVYTGAARPPAEGAESGAKPGGDGTAAQGEGEREGGTAAPGEGGTAAPADGPGEPERGRAGRGGRGQ
jgi:hypothetical protein